MKLWGGEGEGRHASQLSVVRTLLPAVTPWNRNINIININTNINANNYHLPLSDIQTIFSVAALFKTDI